jgi:hypothetical protein
MSKEFAFELGAFVMLKLSGEKGEVIGRAEYATAQNAYYVRYLDAHGCQREDWQGEDGIVAQDV